VGGLLALAGGGFITLLTETLPAGVLRPMGDSLGVSDAAVASWSACTHWAR
jgi:predicted MFS family arabinose efflux permease